MREERGKSRKEGERGKRGKVGAEDEGKGWGRVEGRSGEYGVGRPEKCRKTFSLKKYFWAIS